MRFADELAALTKAPWGSAVASEAELERFLELLKVRPDAHLKASGKVHFTASALVLDASLTKVALHFHKKIQRWLHFGGHIEASDESFLAAAKREVIEESGLSSFQPLNNFAAPFNLHRHAMGEKYPKCTEHWDVQFVFVTNFPAHELRQGLNLSTESEDLSWWEIDNLPDLIAPDLLITIKKFKEYLDKGDNYG